MHIKRGKSFLCPMDKNMISHSIEKCIGKCPGLSTIFFKTGTGYMYLKLMLYHGVIYIFGYLDLFII